MKHFRRHSHRQAIIDACRLIGYTIEPAADHFGPYTKERYRYVLCRPNGNPVRQHRTGEGFTKVITFRFMWQAAFYALQEEGVDVDALKPPRKNGSPRRTEVPIQKWGARIARASERTSEAPATPYRDRGDTVWLDECS